MHNQNPHNPLQPHTHTGAPVALAKVVDSSSGERFGGFAALAGGELLFGPSGPGLSYIPYLAAEGETLIKVRRYADALQFECFQRADDLTLEEKAERDWKRRLYNPLEAYEADKLEDAPVALRGAVRGFSNDARRRMSRTCAKVHDLEKASFVTLTLSDEIVGRFWNKWEAKPDVDNMAAYLRNGIAALDKRGQRFWGRSGLSFGFIWKLENQRRKTGRYRGYLVPHMHLIVTGLGNVAVTRQRRWLKAAWWHICGEAADGHERAGVQLDKVYSRAGAGVYVAKYVAKSAEDAEDAELEIGRRWGMRGTVDTSGEDVGMITLAQYIQIRRYVARWLEGRWKGGRRYARIIRRPRQGLEDGLFIFGAGFQSATGWGLSDGLMRSLLFADIV